jgi:23S rRNA pseudouridine1911/1915/1917 synthase
MDQPQIIFEDDSLFVVDKPSGWITNEAGTTTTQPVIQKWIKDNFDYPLNNDWESRDGIVHRLDKETSGILLVAKTKDAFEGLQRQFKERVVQKTYIALSHGKVEPPEGVINEPVGRLPWRRDRFGVLPDGRDAITNYVKIADYTLNGDSFSLLELKPKTGRTHQIRIHLKHIGHPIVADEFYAGRKTARHDRKWCRRLFLHAGGISFLHPVTKKEQNFNSELPDDLRETLEHLVKLP